MKTSLVVSVSINVILAFILLKPAPKVSNMENYLLRRVAFETKLKKERILRDSLRYASEIKKLNKSVYYIEKKRKNELNLFKSEIAKINNITNITDFHRYNDSIERHSAMRHIQYLY